MTSVQTKTELTEEYKNVKYILTSSMRTKLLLAVYESSKNLEDLRTELKKPSATILHGLKELENINLVKKTQKYYELTSNGFLLTTNMIKLIENWFSINKNKKFWNDHDLSDIPEDMLKSMYLLKEAEYEKNHQKSSYRAPDCRSDLRLQRQCFCGSEIREAADPGLQRAGRSDEAAGRKVCPQGQCCSDALAGLP